MKARRSRFEIIIEILEACQGQGLPKNRIGNRVGVHAHKVKDVLVELVTGELIESQTRPFSFSGQERETVWFSRTREGDQVMRDFKGARERLSTPGARSQS